VTKTGWRCLLFVGTACLYCLHLNGDIGISNFLGPESVSGRQSDCVRHTKWLCLADKVTVSGTQSDSVWQTKWLCLADKVTVSGTQSDCVRHTKWLCLADKVTVSGTQSDCVWQTKWHENKSIYRNDKNNQTLRNLFSVYLTTLSIPHITYRVSYCGISNEWRIKN